MDIQRELGDGLRRRDARPGRGHGHGRSHRRHARRADRADRHAARHLCASAFALRRRIHRRDQSVRGARGGRARRSRLDRDRGGRVEARASARASRDSAVAVALRPERMQFECRRRAAPTAPRNSRKSPIAATPHFSRQARLRQGRARAAPAGIDAPAAGARSDVAFEPGGLSCSLDGVARAISARRAFRSRARPISGSRCFSSRRSRSSSRFRCRRRHSATAVRAGVRPGRRSRRPSGAGAEILARILSPALSPIRSISQSYLNSLGMAALSTAIAILSPIRSRSRSHVPTRAGARV